MLCLKLSRPRQSDADTKCFDGWSLLNVLDGRPTGVTRYKPITDADDETIVIRTPAAQLRYHQAAFDETNAQV